jgi:hypothetical protein
MSDSKRYWSITEGAFITTKKMTQKNNIFFYIAKTILIIPERLFEPIGQDFLQIFLFSSLNLNHKNQSKFSYLNDTLSNVFLTKNQKNTYLNNFCKFQKHLAALSRFAYIYKFNKSKTVITLDLGLNAIDMSSKDTIFLLQNKNKYLFRINDLINVIETSITNSYMLFADPLVSKNPLNNVPFNKSTLYNIYFFMRFNALIIPEMVHKFFLSNFSLSAYKTNYEYLIREHAIIRYINYTDDETLYDCTIDMIYEYGENKIKIDPSFPKNKLSIIMRPYLLLFYMSKHSLINLNKHRARTALNTKLNKFVNFNPLFGRKILKIEKYWSTKKGKQNYRTINTYNDKHINFENQDDDSTEIFLGSHLIK